MINEPANRTPRMAQYLNLPSSVSSAVLYVLTFLSREESSVLSTVYSLYIPCLVSTTATGRIDANAFGLTVAVFN